MEKLVFGLQDNRLCVAAEKSKVLIMGTKELRAKHDWSKIEVMIEGKVIKPSKSEKLLGVVLNMEEPATERMSGDNKEIVKEGEERKSKTIHTRDSEIQAPILPRDIWKRNKLRKLQGGRKQKHNLYDERAELTPSLDEYHC